MPTHNTAREKKVAFFDSTNGIAFGPTFDSEIKADDFEAFADERGVEDIRTLDAAALVELYNAFVDAQEDGDE